MEVELKDRRWALEYDLRLVIDTAIRWPIKAIKSNIFKDYPFSIALGHFFTGINPRNEFEIFDNQLAERLSNAINPTPLKLELQRKFIESNNLYIKWYENNRKEIIENDLEFIYNTILSIVESVNDTINNYFPKIRVLKAPKKEINPRTSEAKLRYLEIVNWYIDSRKQGKTAIAAKNQTMQRFNIKTDTFRKAIKENSQIIVGTEFEADFKFLKTRVE